MAAGAPGDVDGDGHDDVYANGFTQHGPRWPTDMSAHTEGQSWVLSGRTGAVLYRLNDPTPERGGQFGYSLAKTDYNKDGRPDLYIGSSPHHEPGTQQSGGTYVFNGPNGSLLKILDLPPSDVQPGVSAADTGPQLGRSVAAPGDTTGDGEPDYVAGAPTMNVGSRVNEGRMYFFLSGGGGPVPPPGDVGGPPGVAPAGGSSGAGPGPGPDTTAPLLSLTGPLTQRVGRSVTVVALTDEDASLVATGKVAVPQTPAKLARAAAKRKVYRLSAVRRNAQARTKVTLKLRLSRKAVAAVKARLRRGRRSTVRIEVVATDRAGNKRTRFRTVRLKR